MYARVALELVLMQSQVNVNVRCVQSTTLITLLIKQKVPKAARLP